MILEGPFHACILDLSLGAGVVDTFGLFVPYKLDRMY